MSTHYEDVGHTGQPSKTLAERRKALGLSQEKVARLADCSTVRVGQIEREAHDPNPDPTSVRAAIDRALSAEEAKPAPVVSMPRDRFNPHAGDASIHDFPAAA